MNLKTITIVIVVLVIIVPIASYAGFQYAEPKKVVVKDGSTVSLWYYGYIINDGNALIFSTNMKSVANNNTTYPKAPDFKYSPPFTLLNDTVGSGKLIKGLEDGLIGMAKGQTGIITVPPSVGYGLMNSSLIHKVSLYGSTSVFQRMSVTQFKSVYNTTPATGETLKNPIYGWNSVILSYNSTSVYIENEPEIGSQYFPYNSTTGFSIFVDNITGQGSTSVINYYTGVTNGTILPNGSYISGVTNGYYYLNGNSFLVGKTLYFYVDIVKVS
jgi:FKBP-type peptidyl-prolyl cis-trans isomerase 2